MVYLSNFEEDWLFFFIISFDWWFLFSWVFVFSQHKHRGECVKFFLDVSISEYLILMLFFILQYFDLKLFGMKKKHCMQQWAHSTEKETLVYIKIQDIDPHGRKISFYYSQNATVIQESHFVLSICTCSHLFTIKCFTKICRSKSVWKNGQPLSFIFCLWVVDCAFQFPLFDPFCDR